MYCTPHEEAQGGIFSRNCEIEKLERAAHDLLADFNAQRNALSKDMLRMEKF